MTMELLRMAVAVVILPTMAWALVYLHGELP